jgi:hypothetical protein
MAQPEPLREVGAVRRAVDHGLVDARVVEHGGEVGDDLLDRQRGSGQVPARVVPARQADAPVLDHDQLHAAPRGERAQGPVREHRAQPGPAGHDQHGRRVPGPGADVGQVELLRAVRGDRPAHPVPVRRRRQPLRDRLDPGASIRHARSTSGGSPGARRPGGAARAAHVLYAASA